MANDKLILERSFYIGSYMSGILYGLELVMYFMSMHFLAKSNIRRKDTRFYMIYSTALVLLLTIDITCNAIFGQFTWIDHRDDLPGGASEYFFAHITDWYNTFGTASSVALNFIGDALLIYRCWIIWSCSYLVIAFPCLIFLGAFSMAILEVWEGASPGASLFVGRAVSFGVPYYSLTISLNIVVTALIVFRLLRMRNAVRAVLPPEHARVYTGASSILIESALPFSALGIAYVIPYARGSPTAILFAQLWGKFTCLSPQFIILRLAMGKGWNREQVERFSTVGRHTGDYGLSTARSTDTMPRLAHRQGYGGNTVDGNDTAIDTDRRSSSIEKHDV